MILTDDYIGSVTQFFNEEFPRYAGHINKDRNILVKNVCFLKYYNSDKTAFSYSLQSMNKKYNGYCYTQNPYIDKFNKNNFLEYIGRLNIPNNIEAPDIGKTLNVPYYFLSNTIKGIVTEVGPECFMIATDYGTLRIYKKDYVKCMISTNTGDGLQDTPLTDHLASKVGPDSGNIIQNFLKKILTFFRKEQ